MNDLIVRSIILSVDLESLLSDLAIMMKLDLVMMDLELEVAVKHHTGCIKWHCAVVNSRDRR